MNKLLVYLSRKMKRSNLDMNEKGEDGDQSGMLWSKCRFETYEEVVMWFTQNGTKEEKKQAEKIMEYWQPE